MTGTNPRREGETQMNTTATNEKARKTRLNQLGFCANTLLNQAEIAEHMGKNDNATAWRVGAEALREVDRLAAVAEGLRETLRRVQQRIETQGSIMPQYDSELCNEIDAALAAAGVGEGVTQ